MPHSVSARLNPAGMNELVSNLDLATQRAAGRTRDRARANIKKMHREDTGKMKQSANYFRKRVSRGEIVYEVRLQTYYSRWQEEGVKGPIYPRNAKALRFKPKGKNFFVFAKKVNGFKGGHFLKDALNDLKPTDFRLPKGLAK